MLDLEGSCYLSSFHVFSLYAVALRESLPLHPYTPQVNQSRIPLCLYNRSAFSHGLVYFLRCSILTILALFPPLRSPPSPVCLVCVMSVDESIHSSHTENHRIILI